MNNRSELIASLEGRIMGGELHKGGYIHVPQEEAEEILALLKEQEPVKPISKNDMLFCGECKYAIAIAMNFCPKCGKAVKLEWE